MARRQNIGQSLISTLEIVLSAHVVANLEEDDRSSNDKRNGEKSPVADELRSVGDLACIKVVDDCGTDGLNALVETDIVGRSSTRVGQGAHKPGDVSKAKLKATSEETDQ